MTSWFGLGLLGFGAVLCVGSLPSGTGEEGAVLHPGAAYELREGEEHEYRLELAPGEVVEATVEQRGIDVSLSLSDPGGKILLSLDSPTGTKGSEGLVAIAGTGGTYPLRVRAATGRDSGGRGFYLLRLAAPRLARPRDRMRAQACREYSEGDRLRRQGTGEDLRRSLVHYDRALRFWQTLEEPDQQVIVSYRQAQVLRDLGSLAAAAGAYRRAASLTQDTELQLHVLNLLAVLYARMGDAPQALRTGQQALELAPRMANPVSHAAALNNLGVVYRTWGEHDKALELFAASLEIWKKVGPHDQWARTLVNQGDALQALGSAKLAIDPLLQALDMQRAIGDRDGEAETYRALGAVYVRLGLRSIGLGYLNEAAAIANASGHAWIEALALNEAGSVLVEMERLGEARDAFLAAGRVARNVGHLSNEAFALAGLGRVLLAEGDGAGALDPFTRSEELFTRFGDPNALSTVLHGRALAERSLGRLEDSLESIQTAVSLAESLREGVSRRDLQAHVIGARTDLYDLQVDLLLRLHERRPGRGYDAEAFAASEWRRARSMLEMVEKMGAGPPRDLPRDILRRQGILRNRLHELAGEKLKNGRRDLPRIQAAVQRTLARWEELSEEIRRQSPAYAAVAEPKLVGVPEVQEILDPETALIAYTLGEERSTLWWIEKNGLEVYELRSRAELEPLAAEVYDSLARLRTKQRNRAQSRKELLGELLLGPVADRLARVRRLVVVADDALQVLPFAALPVPGAGDLVESHAVVQLPSASLAATLRARQQQRSAPADLIAVFADPVFGLSDVRLGGRTTGESRSLPGEMARLPHSEREALAILDLFPAGRSRRLIGFDANRRNAMTPDLARYRYIHFATHGIVDLENPDLSGIQLSRIDPQGQTWIGEGILPFYEVYNLNLPADLVTLSACQTAVGPQLRGEGPLGMSRSFLYAGASRVVGSLWDVEDAAAADLMILFYRALIEEGLPPSLALQKAQNAMRAQERWSSPHHWAGFVLQGDWR